MSYLAAIDGLLGLAGELVSRPGAQRRVFRLDDMRALLGELGDPQLRFPAVLITGTNGKGSTAATLAAILAAAGYRVGLFTSPHLWRVNERVRILGPDGGEITNDEFAAQYFAVEEASSRLVAAGRLPEQASFFETVTALAFLHFAAAAVDIAVLEVGMGGRLDATNVVEPLVSVITDVSFDHTDWLGVTLDAIAREKAGILRSNGIMVTLPQHREVNEALGEIAIGLGVRGVNAADYIPAPGLPPPDRNRYPLNVFGEIVEIDSPLPGHHQQRNIALAIAAADELRKTHSYKISPADVAAGVQNTVWPGRLEIFPGDGAKPDILLDVAHNPAGAWALRSGISGILDSQATPQETARPITLVFGCLKDKALADMAQILFPLFDRVLLTEVDSPRTATLDAMMAAAATTGAEAEAMAHPAAALQRALAVTPANGLIVVAGSVYLVGRLRTEIVGAAAS